MGSATCAWAAVLELQCFAEAVDFSSDLYLLLLSVCMFTHISSLEQPFFMHSSGFLKLETRGTQQHKREHSEVDSRTLPLTYVPP